MRMFFSYLFFLVFLLVSYLSGFVQKTKLANIFRVHVNIYSYIRMHESRGGLLTSLPLLVFVTAFSALHTHTPV